MSDVPNETPPDEMPVIEEEVPAEGGGNPEDVHVRKLEALLDESTTRAAQTAERLKDTHERYLRVAADFENWKKRTAKEREDIVKFGNERLLRDILPVVDNLERAVQAGGAGSTLLEGVRLVLKQFYEILGRFGVKSFTSVGEPFDPARHEALMQQESDSPPNTVVSEVTKGYLLNDRLIRPAGVVVSKGRPTQPPAPLPDGPGDRWQRIGVIGLTPSGCDEDVRFLLLPNRD